MDNSSIKELIDRNTVETIENEYWEHIEYAENINILVCYARTISALVVIVIAIILLINTIKKKKVNKILLTFFIVFIIITIVTLFIKRMPV